MPLRKRAALASSENLKKTAGENSKRRLNWIIACGNWGRRTKKYVPFHNIIFPQLKRHGFSVKTMSLESASKEVDNKPVLKPDGHVFKDLDLVPSKFRVHIPKDCLLTGPGSMEYQFIEFEINTMPDLEDLMELFENEEENVEKSVKDLPADMDTDASTGSDSDSSQATDKTVPRTGKEREAPSHSTAIVALNSVRKSGPCNRKKTANRTDLDRTASCRLRTFQPSRNRKGNLRPETHRISSSR